MGGKVRDGVGGVGKRTLGIEVGWDNETAGGERCEQRIGWVSIL